MSRRRLPRPSPRRLSVALALLGLLAALAILVMPIEASFDDDPLLRLEPFSPALASAVTDVDCGVPVSNFGRRSEGLNLSDLALANACRNAAGRRAATAVAAASVVGLLGLIALTGSPDRKVAAA
ncbi:MAG TPA: hypothetical protein VGV86_08895 [Acidimicrobiales bacterium]|nr:hypothetical protein [Acidimicrobiales bacterium]